MKKLVSFALLCLMSIAMLSAQGVEEVTLVVSGDGATKEEATHVALRSAIEQAYGTFVSANTAILNDSLIKDEIVTVSSGNIQKYTELAYMQLENGKSYVSLQATVALTKLVKYAQSKGAECEFAGATFGANVKLYELNKANSEKALQNILTVLENTDDLFDYVLEMGEPRIANKGKEAEIPYTIRLYANQNTENFYNYMNATLKAISYTYEQIQPFKKMGYEFNDCYTYTVDVDLQRGKQEYACFAKRHFFYTEDLKEFGRQLARSFNSRIINKLLKDNIGNDYPVDDLSYDWGQWRRCGYSIADYYHEDSYKFEFHGIFPFILNNYMILHSQCCYFNMKNVFGAYLGKWGNRLIIPVDTLFKISSFYLTKKDGSPVPTTTISSEDKLWAGTPPVSLTQEANKDGIPVCTDAEYDLGDIERKSSASVIFRLGKREPGYSYIAVYGHLVSGKEIKKYGYYDVRVTYKHPGFLGNKGAFRVPIRIVLHRADDSIDVKTVYITGNNK